MTRWSDDASVGHPPPWSVVVVRAWAEVDQVRVRLLRTSADGATEQVVVRSVGEATAQLGEWLRPVAGGRLDPPEDEPATPP